MGSLWVSHKPVWQSGVISHWHCPALPQSRSDVDVQRYLECSALPWGRGGLELSSNSKPSSILLLSSGAVPFRFSHSAPFGFPVLLRIPCPMHSCKPCFRTHSACASIHFVIISIVFYNIRCYPPAEMIQWAPHSTFSHCNETQTTGLPHSGNQSSPDIAQRLRRTTSPEPSRRKV